MNALLELMLSGRVAHLPPAPLSAHRRPPGVDEDDDGEDERPIGDPDEDDEGEDEEWDEDDEEPIQV